MGEHLFFKRLYIVATSVVSVRLCALFTRQPKRSGLLHEGVFD